MFKYSGIYITDIVGARKGSGERILIQGHNETCSSHRSRLDIIAHILRSAVGGSRKTSIMYQCNLSFKQLEAYLGLLLSKKLLKKFTRMESAPSRFFETTARGMDFLRAYRNLDALMSA